MINKPFCRVISSQRVTYVRDEDVLDTLSGKDTSPSAATAEEEEEEAAAAAAEPPPPRRP